MINPQPFYLGSVTDICRKETAKKELKERINKKLRTRLHAFGFIMYN
jgi:hypothetical protein